MRRSIVWITLAGALVSAGIAVVRLGHPAPAKAQAVCTLSTMQGTYGYHLQGWFVDNPSVAPVPVAQIGSVLADGSGNMKVATTMSQGGQIVKAGFNFTYQINPDCSGSMTPVAGSDAGPAEFMLTDGGKQMMLIVTQAGSVMSGTGMRQ